MVIKYWNQPKTASLESILNEKLKKGFDKVLLVSGVVKDSGLELVYDGVRQARELGSEVSLMLGVDRKNTSKDMLMRFLDLGCNLYVHLNNDDSKVETRAYVFEKVDGDSFVYLCSSKLSEGGLTINQCLIQEICFSAEDGKAFDNFKAVLKLGSEEVFKSASREELLLLAEKGEVLSRITERKIPSIRELYGEPSLETIANDIYDETTSHSLFSISDVNDVDVEIDVGLGSGTVSDFGNPEMDDSEKVLAKFLEHPKDEEKENKKISIIKDFQDIDFKNTQIFVFQLNKIATSGTGIGEIKLPHYLYESLSDFFGGNDEMCVTFEIDDVVNGKKLLDENVLMRDNGKYFGIKSDKFQSLNTTENDIVRMIKQNDAAYVVEVIRQGTKEYEIWNGFCKYAMKNSKRSFGVM